MYSQMMGQAVHDGEFEVEMCTSAPPNTIYAPTQLDACAAVHGFSRRAFQSGYAFRSLVPPGKGENWVQNASCCGNDSLQPPRRPPEEATAVAALAFSPHFST